MRCKKGDMAHIINGTDGLNVGKVVEVVAYQGEHSKYGPVWRVKSHGGNLITEYGGVGITCDCPDEWLKPFPPEPLDNAGFGMDEPIKEAA
jgi:hypothetical protein